MSHANPTSRLAYIALGSNIDDPIAQVQAGIAHWQEQPDIELMATSSLYRTPPWGIADQPDFINAVIVIRTALEAHSLLATCQTIEQAQKRQKTYRWGPRTLDCDIIHIAGETLADEQLTLPHRHWHQRAFVVLPLLEIAPELVIGSHSVKAAAAKLAETDKAAIHRLFD